MVPDVVRRHLALQLNIPFPCCCHPHLIRSRCVQGNVCGKIERFSEGKGRGGEGGGRTARALPYLTQLEICERSVLILIDISQGLDSLHFS